MRFLSRVLKAYRAAPAGGVRRCGWSRSGVTLVEMMVALSILTIGIIGMVETYGHIQKAIQASKNRTLASNLAQEKMQILKQKVYYQVLATTDPAHNTTDFSPESLDYDTGYFPPEIISEAGVTYTRYTYIQVAREDSGELVLLAPNTPDTGLKLITVTVTWAQGGRKQKLALRNVMSNPDTVMANSVFNGTVRDSADASPINGALVSIVENSGWRDTTSAVGSYVINASPGSYTMVVTVENYYSQMRSVSIAANSTQTQDFSLVKIATGTVTGYAWVADHLVISQIVGSSVNASGFDQEFVEVFNPTTFTWTVDGDIGLRFRRSADAGKRDIQLEYLSAEIAPGGYYLFSNTGTVTAVGTNTEADAVWASGNSVADFPYFATQSNIIPVHEDGGGEGCAAIELYRVSDGRILDQVGWDRSSEAKTAPFYETEGYEQGIGLQRNEFYRRKASPAGGDPNYGPAYDSNNNSVDIYAQTPASDPPNNVFSPVRDIIAATPAAGAVVTCSDGISSSAEAALTGDPPSAAFTLVDVATGTWTVLISSGLNGLERADVTVASGGGGYVFFSSTTFLTEEMTVGLITGRVVDAAGNPISPAIVVTPGAMGAPTNAGTTSGRYTLRVSSGVVDVTANPSSGGTALYVTQSSNTIPMEIGEVHSGVDFVLYQGGRITGFVTRDGINPLPGVAVAVVDSNGIARDQQVSGLDGRFTSVNISTGLYFVRPSVGSHETATPDSVTDTVDTPGLTVFSDTFTISGAMGYISGTVSSSGQAIKTGVLIVVTTVTLAGSPPVPPDLSAATLTGAPYYVVSSLESGTYLAEVRGSTSPPYRVYAYFPAPGGTTTTVLSSQTANISVVPGQTTPGVNFSW